MEKAPRACLQCVSSKDLQGGLLQKEKKEEEEELEEGRGREGTAVTNKAAR